MERRKTLRTRVITHHLSPTSYTQSQLVYAILTSHPCNEECFKSQWNFLSVESNSPITIFFLKNAFLRAFASHFIWLYVGIRAKKYQCSFECPHSWIETITNQSVLN